MTMSPEALIEQAFQHLSEGEEASARTSFRRAAVLARELFAPGIEARAMLELGSLFVASNDMFSAVSAFQEAVARSMEAGEILLEADAHFALAHAFFDLGQSKDGHEALLEAMVIYRQHDSQEARQKLARTTRVYGEHLAILGSAEDAAEALELARLMFVELGDQLAARGVEEELRRLEDFAR